MLFRSGTLWEIHRCFLEKIWSHWKRECLKNDLILKQLKHKHKTKCINIQKLSSSVVRGLMIVWNKDTVKKLAVIHWILKCSWKPQIGWWHILTFSSPLIQASICDYRCQTPETQWFLSFLLPLWHHLTHFMTLPAIVLNWIKIICCFVARGCFQWRGLGCTGFRGVRLALQTQEGSTVSHSQGCQGWTLVFPLRPSPSTPSIYVYY